MILNDLKPLVCSDEVVLYAEYGKPMPFVFDCWGMYYNKEENEMYDTFGDREVESVYTDGDKLVIDIGRN